MNIYWVTWRCLEGAFITAGSELAAELAVLGMIDLDCKSKVSR